MILIQYENEDGFLCQSYVKNKNDNPLQGIRHNPPCLDELNLDIDTQKQLNNALIHSGLISYQDVLDSGGGVTGTLKRLKLKHLRRQLIILYKVDK